MKTIHTQPKSSAYDTDLLRWCRDAVWEVTPNATVILYGSRARGDATPESDYDLLVLVEEPLTRELEDRIGDRLYAVEIECGEILSLVVYEKRLWNTPLWEAMPLHHNVDREGIVL